MTLDWLTAKPSSDIVPVRSGQWESTPSSTLQPASNEPETTEPAVAATTPQHTNQLEQEGTINGELDRFAELLSSGRCEEAVEIYRVLYNQVTEVESQLYRGAILLHAETLASRSDHEAVIELMGQYTSVFYKDLTALSLLAHSQHVRGWYFDEIATLLAALNEATLEDDVLSFTDQLDDAATAQAAILIEDNDASGVISLYEDLIARDPDYPPLQIAFSRALIELGQITRAAEVLKFLPPDSDQVRALLATIERTRTSDATVVPIRPMGEGYIVDAVINGRTTVRLLIDTGASMTIIRPNTLWLAGINTQQSLRTVMFNTANGRVSAPVLRLGSLALGEQIVHDIEVGGLHLEGVHGIDGLLGMNFLNRFRFTLNRQEQVILLTR